MFGIATRSLAATCGLTVYAAIAANSPSPAPAKNGNLVEVIELKPFTDIAYVPAAADPSSIRLESVKAVQLPTSRTAVTSAYYCSQPFQEPGGASPCPGIRDSSPVPAYQIVYSFSAPPMASDEYGASRFTFSVYFHPEDINPAVSQILSSGKARRAGLERYFRVSITNGSGQSLVIDEPASSFCEGNYVDGIWTRTDRNCQDKIAYKNASTPSGYLNVKVTPVDPGQKQLAAAAKSDR